MMVLSQLPEASVAPSGEKATEATVLLCPLRVCRQVPLETCHSLMSLSSLPEASICPFGEKAMEVTSSVCPVRVCTQVPSLTRQIFTTPSHA